MLFVIFFVFVFICKEGNGRTYKCDINASCGCSASSTVLSRIVGGEEALRGSWSWAVSIRNKDGHFCGGSILSPLFIITAAHCVDFIEDINETTIQVGSITLVPSSSNTVYQVRSIAQVYAHPNYDAFTYNNDIALFRLSNALNMTRGNLKPICLPTGNTIEPPNNISMIAVGWGYTSMWAEATSPVLRQVTVQSIANTTSACQSVIYYSQTQFCAGVLAGGKDTCQGDSGGPLMSFINNLWRLDGITSFGDGCALPDKPGVYTRVSKYIKWIKSITQPFETTQRPTTTTTTTRRTTTTTRRPTTTTTTTRRTTTTTRRPMTTTTTRRTTTTTRRPMTTTTTRRTTTKGATTRVTTIRRTLSTKIPCTATSSRKLILFRKQNGKLDTTDSSYVQILCELLLPTTNNAQQLCTQWLLIISLLSIIISTFAFLY